VVVFSWHCISVIRWMQKVCYISGSFLTCS
jgi:hypothetical protein